ncbi:MAG: hypothetical protein JNL21_08210 [Myxococcales bacterium]|nr:hypothetical protein [Myxococcales bacterium]
MTGKGLRVGAWLLVALMPACADDDVVELSTSSSNSSTGATIGTGDNCNTPGVDTDGDGFAVDQGDCNDCDPNASPASVEVPDSSSDEDCDGEVDEEEPTCDDALVVDSEDPLQAARAIDLCKTSDGSPRWGIVAAKWTQIDGSEPPADGTTALRFHRGHGLVQNFGNVLVPRRGAAMLAISTGEARDLDDPQSTKAFGFANPIVFKWYKCGAPDGFPKQVASCADQDPPLDTGAEMYDSIGLELTIRAPANATGLSFDHNFMQGAWPLSCFEVNPFLALMDPMPAGQFDGNIVFDATGDYVGQPPTIRVCGCEAGPPCTIYSISSPPVDVACPLGDAELLGTGFGRDGGDLGGGTGWQRTQAPVEPNSTFTLRVAVGENDSTLGGNHDATVLLDNWQWRLEPGIAVQTEPQ